MTEAAWLIPTESESMETPAIRGILFSLSGAMLARLFGFTVGGSPSSVEMEWAIGAVRRTLFYWGDQPHKAILAFHSEDQFSEEEGDKQVLIHYFTHLLSRIGPQSLALDQPVRACRRPMSGNLVSARTGP